MAIDLGIAGRGNLATTTQAVNQRGAEAAPAANYDEIKAYLGTGSRTAVLRVKYGSSENNIHLGTERFGVRTFKGDRDELTMSVLKASVEAKFGNASYGAELERLLQKPRGGFNLGKAGVSGALTALEAMHANGGVMPVVAGRANAPDVNQVYADQLVRSAGAGQAKNGQFQAGGQSLLEVLGQETAKLESLPVQRQLATMKLNAGTVNQIFRNNDRLVEAGTDDPALTARINALRATYLGDPELAAMEAYLAPAYLSAADGMVFLYPTSNGTFMCIDYENLDKILRLDVDDITIGINEFRVVPKIEGVGLEVVPLAAGEMNPAQLYREFQFMRGALTAAGARNPDPATRTADLLFGADPDFAMIIKSAMHGNYRPLTLDIVNDRVYPALSSAITNAPVMMTPDRWDEMGVSEAHLASLRTAMTDSGIADTASNFAKYLFNLSAVYMNLSGTARLGFEGGSIIPLRAYAYVLMNAAKQADNAVFRVGELDGEDAYLETARADRCADVLSKNMMGTARAIDREIFGQVVHASLAEAAYNIQRPRDGEQALPFGLGNDPGDRGISFLRRNSIIGGGQNDNENIRDIDDFSDDASLQDAEPDHVIFRNFLLQLMNQQ